MVVLQALQSEHGSEVQRLLVTEGRDRVGGNITTVANPQEGYLWEEGPNSFQPSDAILKAAVSGGRAKAVLCLIGAALQALAVCWQRCYGCPAGLRDMAVAARVASQVCALSVIPSQCVWQLPVGTRT